MNLNQPISMDRVLKGARIYGSLNLSNCSIRQVPNTLILLAPFYFCWVASYISFFHSRWFCFLLALYLNDEFRTFLKLQNWVFFVLMLSEDRGWMLSWTILSKIWRSLKFLDLVVLWWILVLVSWKSKISMFNKLFEPKHFVPDF